MSSTKKKKISEALSTPDLVLLSLLAERPMHGYEANAELEAAWKKSNQQGAEQGQANDRGEEHQLG